MENYDFRITVSFMEVNHTLIFVNFTYIYIFGVGKRPLENTLNTQPNTKLC